MKVVSQLGKMWVQHSSSFPGLQPAVGLRPVLWTEDHTASMTFCNLLRFYTGIKLYYLVAEAQCGNN